LKEDEKERIIMGDGGRKPELHSVNNNRDKKNLFVNDE
jgi:hypothetical protein